MFLTPVLQTGHEYLTIFSPSLTDILTVARNYLWCDPVKNNTDFPVCLKATELKLQLLRTKWSVLKKISAPLPNTHTHNLVITKPDLASPGFKQFLLLCSWLCEYDFSPCFPQSLLSVSQNSRSNYQIALPLPTPGWTGEPLRLPHQTPEPICGLLICLSKSAEGKTQEGWALSYNESWTTPSLCQYLLRKLFIESECWKRPPEIKKSWKTRVLRNSNSQNIKNGKSYSSCLPPIFSFPS